MGETRVRIRLYGPDGERVDEALVDTGATFTKVPANIAKGLGLRPRRQVEVELSDGSKISRGLTSAEVEIDGVRDIVPVTVGSEGEPMFIGYTTLEILGFKVNPSTRALERMRPIEYL